VRPEPGDARVTGGAAERPHSPTGYTLVLPPGWEQIPVRVGTDSAITAILDRKFRALPEKLPRDKLVPYRVEVEGRLRKAAGEARKKGAIDLYLPVEFRNGLPVPASFVVAEGRLGTGDSIDPAQIVSRLVSEAADGTVMNLDGVASARTELTGAPDPAQGIEYGSRRVDYAVPVPDDPDRWLLFGFSTVGAGDPDDQVAKMLVQLFDAIMTTFRWTGN
jgi:hypothetical protein